MCAVPGRGGAHGASCLWILTAGTDLHSDRAAIVRMGRQVRDGKPRPKGPDASGCKLVWGARSPFRSLLKFGGEICM